MITTIVVLTFVMQAASVNETAEGKYSSYVDGKRWDFIVSRQDIENSPRWREVDVSPPLPPRVAIQSARFLLWQLIKDARTWRLASVKLQPIYRPGDWIYLVEFAPPPPRTHGGLINTMTVVVLMNGRAIVPVSSKWPPEFKPR